MSRSGYTEYDSCGDNPSDLAMWRGQVASAIRGKRGQAFLRDLITALDALPHKRLICDDIIREGDVCAIGSVGLLRGIDLAPLDPEDHDGLGASFNIARQLVMETEWVNDDEGPRTETPEQRWVRVRAWAVHQLIKAPVLKEEK